MSNRYNLLRTKLKYWLLTRGWSVKSIGASFLASKSGFVMRVELRRSELSYTAIHEKVKKLRSKYPKSGLLLFFDYTSRRYLRFLEKEFLLRFGDIHYLDYDEDYTYPIVHTSNESYPLSALVPVKVKSGVVLLGESRTEGKPVRIEEGLICPHCLNVSNFRELVEWDFTTNNPKPVDVKAMCEVCGGVRKPNLYKRLGLGDRNE